MTIDAYSVRERIFLRSLQQKLRNVREKSARLRADAHDYCDEITDSLAHLVVSADEAFVAVGKELDRC